MCVSVLLLLLPRPAGAWGFDVHRFVTEQAIRLLPAEIRPFYEKHRTFIVEHSIDPDLWRKAGFVDETTRHFLNLDAYGAYPFAGLPRDYRTAVARFGSAIVGKRGLLPWRADEIAGELEGALADLKKKETSRYAFDDIMFYSAVLAHYAADAYVPFHAVVNYDGQLTNQHGIHSRFETDLFARYRTKLSIAPAAAKPVSTPRDFVFDAMLSSFELVEPILQADRRAANGRREYDDRYFDQFVARVQPLLERRLSEAITGVAGLISGAWEKAGRPALPPEPPRATPKTGRPDP